jgi:hypothetical protein
MIYQSSRVFKLWDYTVGHAQLLLRSPASADEPYNIDIVFLGVVQLDIPTRMQGLTMEEPEPLARAEQAEPGWGVSHRITTGGREYVVVAAAFRIYKNQHDLTESSLEYFTLGAEKDPGEVLSHSGLYRRSPEVAGQAPA